MGSQPPFVFLMIVGIPLTRQERQPAPTAGVHNSGWVRDPGDLLYERAELIQTLE